jgi:hypothetical protein
MAKKSKNSMQRVMQDIKSVQNRYKETVNQIDAKGEKVLTMIMIFIQNRAAFYTPQDRNNLINSQYRQILGREGSVLKGMVGYAGAKYAARLHNNSDWTPRRPDERRPQGGAYNPNASSLFLTKGAQESMGEARQAIESEYKNI